MKFATIGFAVALMALGGVQAASAQTISYSDAGALLASSCGPDIQKFCPKVNLGGGALKDCLVAQEKKLNPQCVTDYKTVVASLAARAAAQDAVPGLCRNDVARHCQGMVAGDAHYLSCLNAAKRVVTAACTQAITNAGWN